VGDPHRFGIAQFDGRRLTDIIEKPAAPPSHFAVVGIYFYDGDVFDICRSLTPSSRGELEITDVNRAYCRRGDLQHEMLEGWWCDVGTHEALQLARQRVS
jgi:glucose-1-phosphate thymidylyltransferase